MKQSISASALEGLLDQLPASAQVLSLDCFDTLLWRKVAQPTDVFYSLQNSELFQTHGLTAGMRVSSEDAARKKRKLLANTYEVSLSDIYREMMPLADDSVVAQAVAAEVDCEIAHGFIYEPVARLIQRARARGLRVIVVSDTYLSSTQLRHMLSELMGEGFLDIHHVYCSSDVGKAKTTGIWPEILRREKRQPNQLFHLGDNLQADHEAPARLGIGSTWLQNHPRELSSLLAGRVSAALQIMPELRHTHALPSHFHAQLAVHHGDSTSTAAQIGYHSLGPVLYNFAHFINQELHALQVRGTPVKVAFLLRDGFMPARACELFLGEELPRLNVSRFTAIAASFQCKDDVVQLLASTLSKKSMPALLRQLLLPAEQSKQILEKAHQTNNVELEFARLVLRDETLKLVFEQSRAFRQRLITHVKKRTGVVAGDTLVLVDLGYSGTVQNRLRSVLRDELGIELFGLYLISKQTSAGARDRKALIDKREVDDRLIAALTAYIGLFEMMCSMDEPSTEDYTSTGNPVHASSARPSPQATVLQDIQEACLQFVKDTLATPQRHRPRLSDTREMAQHTAADIARLVYFPSAAEIECLAAFEFEFNLGTDLLMPTANLETGVIEYRREGFAFMNRDFASLRIGYPLEMRHMDISLSTTLLSQQRFGYDIKPSEASFRYETVPTLIANKTQYLQGSERAYATSDGFFSLHLPMSARFDLSALWGQCYVWLQLDSIQRITLDKPGRGEDLPLGEAVFLDGLEQVEGNLVKFSEAGMMYFPACSPLDHGKHMIRVVFRPVLARTKVARQPTPLALEEAAEPDPVAAPHPTEEHA